MQKIAEQSRKSLNSAADFLKQGGVVICPTDTVYGFLANAGNKNAIEKIYKIKKRSKTKPLSIFVKDIKMAKTLAQISPAQEKIIKKNWPGRYTYLFLHTPGVRTPGVCKGGKVALRMPKHEFLLKLLKKINRPLAQTSVNISGQPPLRKISDIINFCENCRTSEVPQILMIDGGSLPKRNPSKIIDLTEDKIKILRK